MRVLLLADDCNPDWPSLPVVAYKFARAIANYVDAVVVTQIRNKPNIDRDGLGNAEVVYLDTERVAAPLYKLGWILSGGKDVGMTLQRAMGYPSYLVFEGYAWRRFKQDLYRGKFDLVHRITPMSPTQPSPIAKLSPIPFVLGPLNGNLPWPKQFQAEQKREREWLSNFRSAYKWLPYYRSTYRDSACILAAFEHTIADLPDSTKSKTINYPEVGIDPELFSCPNRHIREQMTVLFVGRLVPYKLPEVVIHAFATSPLLKRHQLLVVGEGPERPRLESIITEYGLAEYVKLTGKISQVEVGQLMRQAEIFAFPSIRELGAGVVVEAMACGMTCIVVDYGGPASLIDSNRGVKVPMGNRDALITSFREELEKLVNDSNKVEQLGKAAYLHAMEYYSWDVKAQKMLEIYNWVANRQDIKPDFWRSEKDMTTI
ncbi:MAG: glycosyltransferase family 4 protein [Chroococcidiopsidaceae cyanobacterium CP_BM_RX_35]|nr:glycosyltransferase family 4 protein [Chroococcidiopsidaceae cyanobacterium CP_BM_RX_35]